MISAYYLQVNRIIEYGHKKIINALSNILNKKFTN